MSAAGRLTLFAVVLAVLFGLGVLAGDLIDPDRDASADDGATARGDASSEHARDDIGFAATFPTAGRYRLALRLRVDERVETVALTQEVR